MKRLKAILIIMFTGLIVSTQTEAGTFMSTSDWLGENATISDLSADGSVAVGTIDSSPYRWTQAGGIQYLEGSNWNTTWTYRRALVSADGSAVFGVANMGYVESYGGTLYMPQRWTEATGMVSLEAGDLGDYGGMPYNQYTVRAVSADGSTMFGTVNWGWGDYGGNVYRWTETGGYEDELVPSHQFGRSYQFDQIGVTDASGDGSVVVGNWLRESFVDPDEQQGVYVWSESGGVNVLTDVDTVSAVSADGNVVVGTHHNEVYSNEAFLWTQSEGKITLGPGRAFDVSADGSIVIGNSTDSQSPFIWYEDSGRRDLEEELTNTYGLDLNGWEINSVYLLSDDGTTIVGEGVNPEGENAQWIATINPVPLPGTAWMLISGLLTLSGRRCWIKLARSRS